MIVLDSFAVLAFLKDEPASGQVQLLIQGEEDTALTALGVAEVMDHLVRLMGADEEEAALDLAQLGLASPSPVDAELGHQAGLIRARHYHRKNRAVSLADCLAAEMARAASAQLASANPHLLDLPDSTGRTWSP
jgi:PIN domain nuclease of toxin-antitoxin system